MSKRKTYRSGLSFRWDPLFFRNLTLIIATILIWRGVWNFMDEYLFPKDFLLSNLSVIVVGILMLYLFDTEVEEILEEDEGMRITRKHLSDDHIN